MEHAPAFARLIAELEKLPGIGPKTAQRLAYHLLFRPQEEVRALAEAMVQARASVRYCSVCANLTDRDPCPVCRDPGRDPRVICVVEQPRDVVAMERTREFRGRYHVLHGVISPMDGVGPEQLRVRELLARLRQDPPVEEVILATNPTVEGEATALYLARLIKPLGIRVTRIARGVPEGGDLEYVDELTLTRALQGRQAL
ncbi:MULTISPECIES: recombination mediator RecR [Thermaerobacter]|uniref:Recombination protein RecR n=1 Tax=Thermaerobacter subterraneus DSM 13965 TaxID=867903 RepID=K6P0W4_9FIRM|nr:MULTISPECIES: recombination mediator RecR [Thermaerobacter]EKP94745.1 DNA replication and repair protein RecR [Thermaerobacter subterraneus DSM 13965]QIA26150.1 recombination protein RecR [Thermaerobacter sp. PB12/4term]